MWSTLVLALAAGPIQDPSEALAYDPAAGVDLAWVAPGRLALASDGGLRVVDLTGEAPRLVFTPELELAPLVGAAAGRLAGLTTGGEVVVWDAADWREVGRRAGAADAELLIPAGGGLLVGDGGAGLTRVALDDGLPRPVGYPGPGDLEDLAVGADGSLRALPSGWTLDLQGGGWSAGPALAWRSADGANQLAAALGGDLAASFRVEPTIALTIDPLEAGGSEGGMALRVDLGYRSPLSIGFSEEAALLSFPGARPVAGYGSQEVTQTELLGSLELFDATTGERGAHLPREGAAVGFADAAEHRTLVLGIQLAAVGADRWVTLDLVDHQGQPTHWLRLRGADLVAVAEARLEGAGEAAMHLVASGGVVAVAHEEQEVEVFLVDPTPEAGGGPGGGPGGDPGAEPSPDLEPAEPLRGLFAGPRITISAQDDPTGATTPAPRRVFAVRPDGQLMAMAGDSGTIFFANPSTGWPHRVISVRLPREAGRPLAARFHATGELVVTCEVARAEGEARLPQEFTLDAEQQRWSPGIDVPGPRLVAAGRQARLALAPGGNVDLFDLTAPGGPRQVARLVLGLAAIDALAVGPGGELALAAGGRVLHLGAGER